MSDSGTNVQTVSTRDSGVHAVLREHVVTSPTKDERAAVNTALVADDEQHPIVFRGADTSSYCCGSDSSRARSDEDDEHVPPTKHQPGAPPRHHRNPLTAAAPPPFVPPFVRPTEDLVRQLVSSTVRMG